MEIIFLKSLINKLSISFASCVFCRDNIIQPMGVDSEGKLVPLSGLKKNSLTEEMKSESENDEEAEDKEKN